MADRDAHSVSLSCGKGPPAACQDSTPWAGRQPGLREYVGILIQLRMMSPSMCLRLVVACGRCISKLCADRRSISTNGCGRAERDGRWRPNLARLELLTDLSQMQQRDYAESWLWLHFLLESTPARRLAAQKYLAQFRQGGPALRLIESLGEPPSQLNEALLHHLASLRRAF